MSGFSDVLARYGDEAVVHTDGKEFHVKVFVNPVIGERYIRAWKTMTKLGEVDASTYYYFGPPDCNIVDCDSSYVVCNGKEYRFNRAEPFRIEGKVSHWEGTLRLREEEYDDGA